MARDAFITDDFLLESKTARTLYHEHAAPMPIIDYHCHLPPDQIAGDYRYRDMTEVWLAGDHYKWRAMRSDGVAERFVTGNAPAREKFQKWAECMPHLLGNPLYHWTHLELKNYFGISDCMLNPDTAERIWTEGNAKLAEPGMSCRGLVEQSKVVLICTTDDPVDSLEHHQAIAADAAFDVQVYPTWRPDKAMAVQDAAAFNAYVKKLEAAADHNIHDYGSFLEALLKRHRFFHECGCRLSDHGLGAPVADDYTRPEIDAIFLKVLGGAELHPGEVRKVQSCMLHEFGLMDHEKGWVQQFHMGALRNNSTRLFKQLGPDIGCDSVADYEIAEPLSKLLDRLDRTNQLAKTILYNLNHKDNYVLASMIGNFQDGTVPGKIQFGSGWWFLDQIEGMEDQMRTLARLGVLYRFVGMLTDSRSFLSYARHEYFRRILCNLIGSEVERGLMPNDMTLLGDMVRKIAYENAAAYFGFGVPKAP